jgi:hypothetical protein
LLHQDLKINTDPNVEKTKIHTVHENYIPLSRCICTVKVYLGKDDNLKLSTSNMVLTEKNTTIYFEKLLPSGRF